MQVCIWGWSALSSWACVQCQSLRLAFDSGLPWGPAGVSLGLTSWSVITGQEGDDEVQELHGQFPETGCLPTSRH